MKSHSNILSLRSRILRITAVLMMAALVSPALGQGFYQKYYVYLYGQLTNDKNGAPLTNHEVTIVSDTANEPGYYYYKQLYTDNEGFYCDTILSTLEKGALIIKTTDHLENQYDTIVHYRFKWSENNVLFGNFVLPTPPVINIHQANFSWQRNPNGNNKMEYSFTDLSTDMNILIWYWEFGDGMHSVMKDPVHTFSEPGLYKVKLTVHFNTGPDTPPIVSSISKYVHVSLQSYYNMGGHVFAGYFPIDISEVYLYKIEGEELAPIDTAIFNESLGYFLFYQLIEGDYLLKADLHPESELFNMFMPTYFSDKLHWNLADTIFHHSNYFEYDINLAPVQATLTSGPGTIQGIITYDPDYGGGKSAPAENISIILYDLEDQPVNVCHSNEEGEFMLDELDLQMYYVYAEVTGLTTIPVEVILEENMNGVPIVHLVIDNQYVSGEVNSGVADNHLEYALGEVYPNPAANVLSLDLGEIMEESLTCSIINVSGQVVLEEKIETRAPVIHRLNVSGLRQGTYFVRIADKDNNTAVRKFIKE